MDAPSPRPGAGVLALDLEALPDPPAAAVPLLLGALALLWLVLRVALARRWLREPGAEARVPRWLGVLARPGYVLPLLVVALLLGLVALVHVLRSA